MFIILVIMYICFNFVQENTIIQLFNKNYFFKYLVLYLKRKML